MPKDPIRQKPTDTPQNPGPGKQQSARAEGSPLDDLARALEAAKDVPKGLEREERDLRGAVIDRRVWPDRRNIVVDGKRMNPDGTPAVDPPSGLDRRRGPGRRLSDFSRAAEEGEMTREQFLFLMAIDEFKKANAKAYPTWTDVLEVVRLLGYRKTARCELNLRRAEDWQEPGDAPSNVRPKRWNERHKDPGSRDAA